MKTTRSALLAMLLCLGSATAADAQASSTSQLLIIPVTAGIRIIQDADLAFDPNTAGNADGFLTTGDGNMQNSQAATWTLEGSNAISVVYDFDIPSQLDHMTVSGVGIPVSTLPISATATCESGPQSWDPSATPSAVCSLAGLTLPLAAAVDLDFVSLDMTQATEPGNYMGTIRLTATIQ
jgi:uncharacterized cupredoxin-like copper-binding protein